MSRSEDKVRTLILQWNRSKTEEVVSARKKFEEYMNKGWLAFKVTADQRKIQVYTFDPAWEKIWLVPIVEGG